MVQRVLVFVSVIACALVTVSFGLFALDQVSGASKGQVRELAGTTAPPSPSAHRARTAQPRRFIDGAAGALTSPFDGVVASNSQWVNHGLPTIAALAVYGLGLGYLARFSRGLT